MSDIEISDAVPEGGIEEEEEEEDQEMENKIRLLPGSTEDGTAASFQILNEDHTIGNSLRYIIMKNPEVEFCGYSIPHPSEPKLNIRIQTYGKITAVEALKKGFNDLIELCEHVEDKFTEQIIKADVPIDFMDEANTEMDLD